MWLSVYCISPIFPCETAFKANMESRTCAGMVRHIDTYGSMELADRQKMQSFLGDPSSVTADDVKKFPKEIFSSLNVSLYLVRLLKISDFD